MKLARPDVFHPRIVLAGCRDSVSGDGDDDGLMRALGRRGLFARWRSWDDAETARADLVILRGARDYADRLDEFLAWTTSVPHLLNAPDVVAWNVDKRSVVDVARRGVATVSSAVFAAGERVRVPTGAGAGGEIWVTPTVGSVGTQRFDDRRDAVAYAERLHEQGQSVLVQRHDSEAVKTDLVFLGGKPSHAFAGETPTPVEPDFELWDVGFAALDAAGAEVGNAPSELLYARVTVVGGFDDPRLLDLDLVSPSLGWRVLDDDARERQQRQFALTVESALERLGLGPLSHRRP